MSHSTLVWKETRSQLHGAAHSLASNGPGPSPSPSGCQARERRKAVQDGTSRAGRWGGGGLCISNGVPHGLPVNMDVLRFGFS